LEKSELDMGEKFNVKVDIDQAGMRLDQALAVLFPDFSRARLQSWIKQGMVKVDGVTAQRPRDKVIGGELVELEAELEDQVECAPQPIPLDIVFEDDFLLVLNKPAGLVVHPAAGNPDGTLQNALLHHDESLIQLPRAGIVHRLDKETSGLLVVAKTTGTHKYLVEQLQERLIKREYRAVATGVMTAGGTVDQPIGRHPTQRTKMAVHPNGKPAVTHYRVIDKFRFHTHLKVVLETGRTHQIRVHMAHLRYPLVGDPVYAGRLQIPPKATPELEAMLRRFRRQALHARKLGLNHPKTDEWIEWKVEPPEDMQKLLAVLAQDGMYE
jgi:23S rRNA pseudouridine1911/1915/1917 synthase